MASHTLSELAQGLGLVLTVTSVLPGFTFVTVVSGSCFNDVSWALASQMIPIVSHLGQWQENGTQTEAHGVIIFNVSSQPQMATR